MLDALRSLFGAKQDQARPSKTVDLEARLSATSGGKGRGEVEFEAYSDGTRSLEIELSGVDPGEIEIVIGAASPRRIATPNGRCDEKLSSRTGDHIPECGIGDRVEVRQRSSVIMTGSFVSD
jgi:hypothetical protein